jgi:hypothetical protein
MDLNRHERMSFWDRHCSNRRLAVGMVLAGNLEERRERSLVLLHEWPDLVCDLRERTEERMSASPDGWERGMTTTTYVLVDEDDSDIGPVGELLKDGFNRRYGCLCERGNRSTR